MPSQTRSPTANAVTQVISFFRSNAVNTAPAVAAPPYEVNSVLDPLHVALCLNHAPDGLGRFSSSVNLLKDSIFRFSTGPGSHALGNVSSGWLRTLDLHAKDGFSFSGSFVNNSSQAKYFVFLQLWARCEVLKCRLPNAL